MPRATTHIIIAIYAATLICLGATVPRAQAENGRQWTLEQVAHIPGARWTAVEVLNENVIMANAACIEIKDMTDPANPVHVSRLELLSNPAQISMQGSVAWIAGSEYGLQAVDLSDPTAPAHVGTYAGTIECVASVPGIAFVDNGDKLQVVDISDATNPQLVRTILSGSPINEIQVDGNRLFVAIDAGLMVYTIDNPRSPILVGGSGQYPLDRIEVDGDIIWGMFNDGVDNGVVTIDVSTPSAPVATDTWVIGRETTRPDVLKNIIVRGSQCLVVGNYLYVLEHSGQEIVYRFIPDSNWGMRGTRFPVLHGDRIYDPGYDLNVVDASNLSTYLPRVHRFEAKYVGAMRVRGDYMFLGYNRKVDVFDISHPGSPRHCVERTFDGEVTDIEFRGDLGYMVTDGDEIAVVDINQPLTLPEVGAITRPEPGASGRGFVIRDDRAYAVDRFTGVYIFDMTAPEPALLGTHPDTDTYDLAVAGNYAYLVDGIDGIAIIDVSDPQNTVEVARYSHFDRDPHGSLTDVAVQGTIAYVLDSTNNELVVLDVSDPTHPAPIDIMEGLGGWTCRVADNKLFIAGEERVHVLDVRDSRAPTLLAQFSVSSPGNSIEYEAPYVYAIYYGGVYILELKSEGDPPVDRRRREIMLQQNVPNPFNPTTVIPFELTEPQRVTLSVFNARGQLVRTLASDVFAAGTHRITWDGTDAGGTRVGSGVYFYKLTAGDAVESRKMLILK